MNTPAFDYRQYVEWSAMSHEFHKSGLSKRESNQRALAALAKEYPELSAAVAPAEAPSRYAAPTAP